MAAKTLPGFKRVPGAARKYRNAAGLEISDRQYRRVRAAVGELASALRDAAPDAVEGIISGLSGAVREVITAMDTARDAMARTREQMASALEFYGPSRASPQRHAKQVHAQRQYNRLLSQAAARARQEGAETSKAAIRKTEAFKQTIRDIKSRPAAGHRPTEAQEARKRRALETLGYREGIPDWVPVGLSDRYRAGKLRRDRIPRAWRPDGSALRARR